MKSLFTILLSGMVVFMMSGCSNGDIDNVIDGAGGDRGFESHLLQDGYQVNYENIDDGTALTINYCEELVAVSKGNPDGSTSEYGGTFYNETYGHINMELVDDNAESNLDVSMTDPAGMIQKNSDIVFESSQDGITTTSNYVITSYHKIPCGYDDDHDDHDEDHTHWGINI